MAGAVAVIVWSKGSTEVQECGFLHGE
jgi:stage V sporulation protein SpoVS